MRSPLATSASASLLLLVVLAGSGCLGAERDPTSAGPDPVPVGLHPWPNEAGVDWPLGLVGPFQLASVTNVKIPSFDGILLDGWVLQPAVPAGVKVPVVLWAAPYFGLNNQAGNDPAGWDNSGASEAVPVNLLVENGFAVAILNLRGSGNSQGCYQLFGSIDWKDLYEAVEWLGTQEWSNGRVGMMGLSYHGTTPWQAAVLAPPHLKTIVTAGQVSQLYTFLHTPQGAPLTAGAGFTTLVNTVDMAPPLLGTPQELASDWPSTLATKLCPELVGIYAEPYKTDHTDERDAAFWDDRDILAHYSKIQASVFLTMGLLDNHGSGHQMQEDYSWANLPAGVPKRALLGQWGHMFPNFSDRYTDSGRDWDSEHLPWLDFWLKGVGDPASLKLGVVEYQDSEDQWHTTSAWPPPEGKREAIYLAGEGMGADPGAGTRTFRPHAEVEYYDALCEPTPPGSLPAGLLYQSEPVENATLAAGNPFVLLDLESDQPGGLIVAFVVAVEEGGLRCGNGLSEGTQGMRFLGMGAADLRHHAGNYRGSDFPTDTPTKVRIEISNFAEVLGVGERLGLILSGGDNTIDGPEPYAPVYTVHEGLSHVVVPVVDGTFGGGAALAEYPLRPFDPMGGDP